MNDKEKLRQKLFELRLQQAYYMMEHKQISPEIKSAIDSTKIEYSKVFVKNRKGDNQNDKH